MDEEISNPADNKDGLEDRKVAAFTPTSPVDHEDT